MWDQELGCSQKRDSGTLRHLSFWVSGVELPLIFLYKKKKKKINTITYSKYFKCYWLNKKKVQFGRLTLQGFGPSYNLCKKKKKNTKIQNFGPSYILPKLKTKH